MNAFYVRLAGVCIAVAVLAGCSSPLSRDNDDDGPLPMPSWTLSPKAPDSMFTYVVGASGVQNSPSMAREDAYQNAILQLRRMVMSEAGYERGADLPDDALISLEGTAIVPDCVYIDPGRGGFTAYVQLSYPLVEKKKAIERLRKR